MPPMGRWFVRVWPFHESTLFIKMANQELDPKTVAHYACLGCREAKRKCDRIAPECTLCLQYVIGDGKPGCEAIDRKS